MRMDLNSGNEAYLVNFPPILRKNFEELLSNGNLGVSPFTLTDLAFTKPFTVNNSTYYYSCTLKVPYAGKRLSWDLIFNPENLGFAPDFNFNDDTFTMSEDLDLVINNIPSLVNWNVNNPKSLKGVLQEFLVLFKKQQIQKMQDQTMYSSVNLSYQMLSELLKEHDVEIYIENLKAHFMINVNVDTSSLPEYLQPSYDDPNDKLLNPGTDSCILKVSYLKLDGSKSNTSLQLSPRLNQSLANLKLQIPQMSGQKSLAEYTTDIIQFLQQQVDLVANNFKLKNEYINSLCATYGHNLIEFDSETFSKAVILLQVDNYDCIVIIKIGDNFPKDQPTIILKSLYCLPRGPCQEEIINYPYSPRWPSTQMLQKLMLFLMEAIGKFKNHKH